MTVNNVDELKKSNAELLRQLKSAVSMFEALGKEGTTWFKSMKYTIRNAEQQTKGTTL